MRSKAKQEDSEGITREKDANEGMRFDLFVSSAQFQGLQRRNMKENEE